MSFFDPTTITDDFDLVPMGEYECIIDGVTLKGNKSGTGDLIKITYTITSDSCKGRKMFDNLNWIHENAAAQEIGRKTLARIIRAVFGEPKAIDELEELNNQRIGLRVTHRKDRNGEMREQLHYMLVDSVKNDDDTPF